jgi:hypothetical protein
MNASWYYIEKDETVGPMTLDALARRIQRTGQSCLVWTEGMAEWTEAEAVPALSRLIRSAPGPSQAAPQRPVGEEPAHKQVPLKQRLKHELIDYFVISAYLFICFATLLFYKAAIRQSDGIEFAPFGIAIVKALIVGKFVLLLNAFGIGERRGGAGVLLVDIIKKSVLFLLCLGVLTVIEEAIVGHFHGRTVLEAVSEIGGGTLQQAIATSILMLLILIPYFAFRLIAVRLGEGALWKLLTQRPSAVSI